jgi:serine phosphatase RsbU (regulator of sigma subunit)/tetratricopeptide (TPR) repeat protein
MCISYKMKLFYFFALIFWMSNISLFAQEDSLLNLIPSSTNKEKANIYRKLAEQNLYKSNSNSREYANLSIEFSEKSKDLWCQAYSLRLLGIHYDIHGDYKLALEKIEEGLRINREINDVGGISACLSSLGIIYFNQGKYDKALEIFLEVIKYYDDVKSAYNKSLTISNIAAIYKYQKDNKKSIFYYREAYRLMKISGSKKGLGISANNMGLAFFSAQQNDSALLYLEEGLRIKRELGDKRSLSFSLSNLSQLYEAMGNHEKASEYLNECILIQTDMGDKKGLATSKVSLGDLIVPESGYTDEVVKNFVEAYNTAVEIGDLYLCQLASHRAAMAYFNRKEFENAAKYMYDYTVHKDSLYSTEKAKSFAEMETRFDTEKKEKEIALLNQQNAKKELQLSIANNERLKKEKDFEILNKDKEVKEVLLLKANADKEAEKKQNEVLKKDQLLQSEILKKEKAEKDILNEQNKKKAQQVYAFAIGSVLLLGLLFFVFRSYSQKKKANALLESQNDEIKKQKEEIVLQSEIIEEKNKDVTASINYAKRLQDAILPSATTWNSILPDSFILYLPKDIVAGDFYFIEKVNDLIIVAAADCTGHGVPGAMVSVVCSNAMNRAVKEFKLTEPGKILDKVREMVIDTFSGSEQEVKDGMDISLAVINKKDNSMKWSGANNPLLIVRRDESNIPFVFEINADKQPIGYAENLKPFTTHEINLVPNDTIYLFTDGYADQFGGQKGKKFKYNNLKNVLLENANTKLDMVKSKLFSSFENWKGELEQVDDVCVIGIRI